GGTLFYIINCIFLVQIISFARYRIKGWNNFFPAPKVESNSVNCITKKDTVLEDMKTAMKRRTVINRVDNSIQDHAILKPCILDNTNFLSK
uniref:Uncharacterized protein n=1 Tax=Ciona savignyi TaxID=51511 RepID=H2YH08_CIOSA